MRGWIVVNPFLVGDKYDGIYNRIVNAFNKRGISVKIVKSSDLVCDIAKKIEGLPEFVLFWDKDVVLARRLEREGVAVFNSARAIELCDNKILTCERLVEYNIPIPQTVFAPKTFCGVGYANKEFLLPTAKILGFPFVIKEAYGSFGAQVYLANDLTSAEKIVQSIDYRELLIQRFISSSKGRDVRVNVVGGEVVCAILRTNANDFRSNVSNGGTASAYDLDERQKEIAIKASRALNLDFCGVDVLFGDDGPLVCEINSNPHFISTFNACGIDLSENISDYVIGKLK